MPRFVRSATDATLVDDEERALLHDEHEDDIARVKASQLKARPTPLPKLQMLALCTMRLVEPVSFTHIFPYVNEMMEQLAVTSDPQKIGYYSGFVESIFAVMQLCSIYQWAKVSDVIGRRPVLFIGALGLALSSVLFGLSKSLAMVVVARCLAGLFSGTASVVQSVLGDITDASNQSIAFPIFGLIWPLGSIVGPLIGGTFSNPADQYPRWFSATFWREFPYFLPGAIAAGVSVLAVLFGYMFLKETVKVSTPKPVEQSPAKDNSKRQSYGTVTPTPSDDGSQSSITETEPPSIRTLLASPLIRALCASGLALSFLGTAFNVVFVLFCFSPVEAGGLSLSAAQIGYTLSSAGFVSAGAQLLVMPTLLARVDHVSLHRACMGAWPAAYALFPVLNLLARASVQAAENDRFYRPLMWVGLALSLLLCQIGWLSYSVSMILVKQSAPSPVYLGRTNGLAQFAQCLARAVAPAFVSSLYASTAGMSFLGGYSWVVVMVAFSYWGYTFGDKIDRVRHLLDQN